MNGERARFLAHAFGYDWPRPPQYVFVPWEIMEELTLAGLVGPSGQVDWDALGEMGGVRRWGDGSDVRGVEVNGAGGRSG